MAEFKSAELEQWAYRDPSLVCERREAQSCKGCKFECIEKMFGIRVPTCKKNRPHGRKCKHFIPISIQPVEERL